MKKTLSILKKITANLMITASLLSVKEPVKIKWCWTATALTTIPLCISSSIALVLPMKIKDRTIKNILQVSKQECIKIHQDTKVWREEHLPTTFIFLKGINVSIFKTFYYLPIYFKNWKSFMDVPLLKNGSFYTG